MYTNLVSRVLFPLHERMKGHHSVALHDELERSQWQKPAALAELQVTRLRQFLIDAARNVPYYRDLFARSGFDATRVSSVADLGTLPFLTKSLVRENVEALKSTVAGR